MMEHWKDVAGYEGLYQVSDLGRVKSLRSGKIMSLSFSRKTGYKSVILYRDGMGRTYGVHRLVAIAFCPNPDGLNEVNHKDECKVNNRAENLEWCTHQYNVNYGTMRLTNERRAAKQSKPCIQLKDGVEIARYCSTAEAARQTGFALYSIQSCLKGYQKQTHGYQFEYVSEWDR